MKSDILYYFTQELFNAGFIMPSVGEDTVLNAVVKEEIKDIINRECNNESFEEALINKDPDNVYIKRATYLNCVEDYGEV
jgi:hypothetical protein